ncbi:MAG TPA: ABC transporter ATP-binding protein [Pseudonocardiaceae bacterium]|jgi:NitT/TauT family transport system ATP-binding protein
MTADLLVVTDTTSAGVFAAQAQPQARAGSVVELAGVRKVFGRGRAAVVALDGLDLRVGAGEFVCLIGASGCGKTTLLNLVAGLDEQSAGTVRVNTPRPAVMFQEAALMPWLTAARNVELALRLAGVARASRRTKVGELLELVRLDGQGDKRPHELSGGMRQRVALARSLASTLSVADGVPGLLLMDEPFASLDAITRDLLQGELLRIWRTTRTAVLFVTHDVREAVRLGQRVVLMSSRPGRVVASWDTASVRGAAEQDVVEQINARLREVLSSHAA